MLSVRCSSKFADRGLVRIFVRDTVAAFDGGRLVVISDVFTKFVEVELAAGAVVICSREEVVAFLDVLNSLVSKSGKSNVNSMEWYAMLCCAVVFLDITFYISTRAEASPISFIHHF